MALRPQLTRRLITYGLTRDDADVTATESRLEGFGSESHRQAPHRERRRRAARARCTLQVPGRHSVQNALAAVAVGLELDVPFERIAPALADFQGAERRFQQCGVVNGITVVDDYGHHPTEIAAVLAAARAAKPARISWRFSRTATRARAT